MGKKKGGKKKQQSSADDDDDWDILNEAVAEVNDAPSKDEEEVKQDDTVADTKEDTAKDCDTANGLDTAYVGHSMRDPCFYRRPRHMMCHPLH